MLIGPHGEPLPPEIEEALRARQEHAEMHAEARQHEMLRFFEEMSIDQLLIMRSILSYSASDESGKYAAHLEGFVNGVLQWKHQVCIGCGKKHDPSELLEPIEKPESLHEVAEYDDGTEQLELSFDENGTPDDLDKITEAQYQEKLLEYLVRVPNNRDLQNGLVMEPHERPVICELCGALYQSLEDRMLRPPGVDGCFGCQNKAAHG